MNHNEKRRRKIICSMCRKIHCLLRKIKPHKEKNAGHEEDYFSVYLEQIREVSERLNPRGEDIIVYRGQRDKNFKLLPYLFRKDCEGIKKEEAEILKEIEAFRPEEFSDMITLDKLVHLQHYGFPTRLLDVTLNPLVALYFAAKKSSSPDDTETDGAVIVCKIPKRYKKAFDSQTVTALANLANLSEEMKKALLLCRMKELREEQQIHNENLLKNIEELKNKSTWYTTKEKSEECNTTERTDEGKKENNPIKAFSDSALNYSSEAQDESRMLKAVKQILGLVRAELPYFPGSIMAREIREPVYVMPKQLNPRIRAQSGAFLLFGLLESIDGLPDFEQEKIVISNRTKSSVIQRLDSLKINEAVLFPELDKFLDHLKRTYSTQH